MGEFVEMICPHCKKEIKLERGKQQKLGMIKKASQGAHMSRTPFGYKWENKKLIPALNYREVEEIFEEFLQEDVDLSNLAKKRNFSVNGLKKIFNNFYRHNKIFFCKKYLIVFRRINKDTNKINFTVLIFINIFF